MSKILKISCIAILAGSFSGILSSLFLHSLSWVTEIRQSHSYLIWGLPLFGLFFGYSIKRIPHHINQGVPYIISNLDNHQSPISFWMAPFIFITSLGTHLFGGSAGREGVGVIMGASIAQLTPRLGLTSIELRAHLIYAGIAAGFSSIFGTPLAAIIFAFELHQFKDIKKTHLLLTTALSSLTGWFVTHNLGPHHQVFEVNFTLNNETLYYLLIASITAGLGAHFFYWGMKYYTHFISRLFPKVQWKLFFGGFFISAVVFLSEGHQYIGIGTEMIGRSFITQMMPYDFIMKCLLTIMTLSIGFKGGEVTPLFFMGATLSNSTASLLNLKNFSLSSSLGMVSLFGAVTGTPLASAIMGAELFGWEVGVLSLACCFLARLLMGRRSIYRH